MKATNLPFLLLLVIVASAIPAFAGDSGYAQRTTYTGTCFHSKWDGQPRAIRVVGYPFVLLGRAGESFLHWPQILSEGLEGDRALVNKRGVLAPREVPVEDAIVSPAD